MIAVKSVAVVVETQHRERSGREPIVIDAVDGGKAYKRQHAPWSLQAGRRESGPLLPPVYRLARIAGS